MTIKPLAKIGVKYYLCGSFGEDEDITIRCLKFLFCWGICDLLFLQLDAAGIAIIFHPIIKQPYPAIPIPHPSPPFLLLFPPCPS